MRTKKFLPLFAGHHPPAELAAYSVMGKKTSFILHLHPEQVPASTLRYTHTFGLGGMTALLILLQITTGILLRFVYVPSPAGAYDSILFLQREVPFGQFVRNIHHLGGVLLIVISFLHLLRVFFTGAFHPPVRSGNWVIGLVMFLLIMSSNFTGYLLPWDQLSYWAVTIATSMLGYIPGIGIYLQKMIRGGPEVGAATLQLFYFFHTTVVPALMFLLMAYHFWFVRKAGGVLVPAAASAGQGRGDKTVPLSELLVRECAFAAVVTCMLLIFSMFVDAPLTGMANPDLTPPTVKAPWYFMGLQEFLMHIHPSFVAFVMPGFVIGFFIYISYQKDPGINTGVWFNSDEGKRQVINGAVFSFILTAVLIIATEHGLDFRSWFPSLPLIVSTGFFPLLLYMIPAGGYVWYIWKKQKVNTPELYLVISTIIIMAYLVMMLTGLWLRGESMKMIFP